MSCLGRIRDTNRRQWERIHIRPYMWKKLQDPKGRAKSLARLPSHYVLLTLQHTACWLQAICQHLLTSIFSLLAPSHLSTFTNFNFLPAGSKPSVNIYRQILERYRYIEIFYMYKYLLHWNLIHKLIRVAGNVYPYKLIGCQGILTLT